MVDELFVPIDRIQIFVSNHDASAVYVGRVPERRAQRVKLRPRAVNVGNALGVDEIVAVNNFDDGIFHKRTPL